MLTPEVIGLFCTRVLKVDWPLTGREMNELIFPERRFWVDGYIGKGAHGLVLSVQSLDDNRSYAVKLYNTRNYPSDDAALREFQIQRQFATYNMAPRVHQMDIRRMEFRNQRFKFARVIMERWQEDSLQDLLVKSKVEPRKLLVAFECLLKKKFLLNYPHPFLHSDMHSHNIKLAKDNKTLGFIDFGMTVQKPALLQLLDVIPLVSSLLEAASKPQFTAAQRAVLQSFAEGVLKIYNRFFHVRLELDRFEVHPTGQGYQYRTPSNTILHSYDWPVNSALQRVALPTEADIREAFPTIDPPTVTDD